MDSEYPLGEKVQRGFYVERDRLQSGLSDGVIVVETELDGGTMHTDRLQAFVLEGTNLRPMWEIES